MNTPNEKQPSKSSSCDASNDQSGVEKQTKISRYPQPEVEAPRLQINDNQDTICSDTWTCFQELEALPWQQSSLGEYRQLSLWKSTPTHKQSSNTTFQDFPFTQTSETITQNQESLTSLPAGFPAQAHQTQELERDSSTQPQHFGEKDLDVSLKPNPSSVLWNNLKELSDGDFELFLGDSLWQDILLKLKQSRRESLGRDTRGSDYLSFPTLTSNVSSTSRPEDQTKCDRWFKDNGLIQPGYQLGTRAIASLMGFPLGWFEGLSEQYSKNLNIQNQVKPQAELEQDTSQDEQLHQDKQRSPSAESSTSQKLLGGEEELLEHKQKSSSLSQKLSIPCLVKQPKQLEIKGVIRKDEGDRFDVYIPDSDSTITVSKLFVYPDLSQLDKCSRKNLPSSKNCSSKTTPPSKNCSRKNRRKKGEGSGAIFYRTVTKNGRDYQEAYYHWRDNGKQKSKYIPKKLLDQVKQAESRKLPVSDILVLLGCIEKCSRKKSDTSIISTNDKVIDTWDKCSRKKIHPSKKRREKGRGTAYIECKPITKNGLEYKQYWFHWQVWRDGETVIKKSRYIPKRLVPKVEKMNNEKTPVAEILSCFEE